MDAGRYRVCFGVSRGSPMRWGLYGLGAFLLAMSLMPGVAGAVGAAGFVLVILGAFGHKGIDP
ncbi:P30 [Xanthomonas phage phiL7]|uniref:p30 n=1 Tax=Xanthomonas phage phiL7 TaxID=538979 RepID=C4ML30_9CAUD|nr:P30 [Xanthomonas phage phiL7]ACE75770.1 P30 [Xanthomonas phage phiL7]